MYKIKVMMPSADIVYIVHYTLNDNEDIQDDVYFTEMPDRAKIFPRDSNLMFRICKELSARELFYMIVKVG